MKKLDIKVGKVEILGKVIGISKNYKYFKWQIAMLHRW